MSSRYCPYNELQSKTIKNWQNGSIENLTNHLDFEEFLIREKSVDEVIEPPLLCVSKVEPVSKILRLHLNTFK